MSDYAALESDLRSGHQTDVADPPWFDAASLLQEIREDVRRLLLERPHDDALRHRVERTYWELRKHLQELAAGDLIDALGDPFATEGLQGQSLQSVQVAVVCS